MARILTITANPLLDFLAPEALTPGAVTRSTGFQAMAGGKGINVSRVLRRHGHDTTTVFFAGGGSGHMLNDLIAADDLNPLPVPTAARSRVGFICAAAENRPQGALLENGFRVSPAEAEQFIQTVSAQLPGHDLVAISGSVPDTSCAQIYATIAEHCAQTQVPCWIDSYGPAMDQALVGAHPPALSKPNRQEYEQSQNWQRCGELHITDGGGPTMIHHADSVYRLTPPAVAEVNPVGSGDCYVAGLAHGFLSGWSNPERWRYAAACGAANAARWDIAAIGPEDVAGVSEQAVLETVEG